MAESPNDHNYDSKQKHEQGDPVHTMHKLQIEALWRIGIARAKVEVSEHLFPNTVFHKKEVVFVKLVNKHQNTLLTNAMEALRIVLQQVFYHLLNGPYAFIIDPGRYI